MAISQKPIDKARLVTVIAATVTSLACGTGYAFSAWGPSFAEKMVFSSTQTNLIGASGNLGMYGAGIPLGYMVDKKGPRVGSIVGCIAMGLGYFALYKTYQNGPGSMPLPLICLFTFIAGAGGSSAFGGSIKTAAMNFPHSRGTATAFPVAAFGLSALFFSLISSLALPGDTAGFLLFLSLGTFLLIALPALFMRILPHPRTASYTSSYTAVPADDGDESKRENKRPRVHRRASSKDIETGTRHRSPSGEPGSSSASSAAPSLHGASPRASSPLPRSPLPPSPLPPFAHPPFAHLPFPHPPSPRAEMPELCKLDTEDSEHAATDRAEAGEEEDEDEARLLEGLVTDGAQAHGSSLYADVRGWALLRVVEFYQLFAIIGVLTGVGLMTINNIGNDAQALWSHWDENTPVEFIHQRQSMHVSIISMASFTGRLCSGIGSDLIVEKLHMSRIWCFVLSSLLFCLAQICGLTLQNPNFLFVLSSVSGLAYGFLFGVGPSITAETFGPHGLSQNWGTMTLSPIIFANIYNLMYGRIYDGHSVLKESGHRECLEGRECYREAYWVTFYSSVAAILFCLWSIRHGQKVKERKRREGEGRHLA